MFWLPLALVTAFFESLKDFFAKRSVSQKTDLYWVAWATHAFALPLIALAVWRLPFPHLDIRFFQAVVLSASLNCVSALLMVHAFEASDLSLSMPMLTLSPLFMLLTSPLMLGEFPSRRGLLGVLLIVSGSYVLNINERVRGWWGPFRAMLDHKGPRYMLGVALIWSVCANIDKIGVRHSSPWHWILGFEIGITFLLSLLLAPRLFKVRSQLAQRWHLLLPIGLCGASALLFQMHAITMTQVAYVVAIKRISVLLSVLWGTWFLGERHVGHRLLAVLIMLAGVFMIAV